MDSILTDYGTCVIRWRWALLSATLVLAAVVSSGVRYLTINDSYRVLFSEDNPQLLAYEALEQEYITFDNLFFLILPIDGDVFTQATLTAIEDLTEKGWEIPFARRVDSITNYQHSRADGDDIFVSNLIEDAATATPETLEMARRIALADPTLLERLIAKEGDATGVSISIGLPEPRGEAQDVVVAEALDLVEEIRAAHPGVQVHVTGVVMMNDAFKQAALRDMRILAPVMYMGIILVVFILLRSVSGTLLTMLVVALSTTTGMGAAGWAGVELSASSAAAPIMILTLAVADCVHILLTLLRSMRQGTNLYLSLQESLRVNIKPVFLTSLTTVIGFLTMNFSDSPPLRDVGNITAVGVVAAFVYSVVLLPALAAICGVDTRARRDRGTLAMAYLARFVVRHRRAILWIGLGIVVLLTGAITQNEINDQWVQYFDTSLPFRQAADLTLERVTGVYIVVFPLNSGRPNGITDPEFLRTADAFVKHLRDYPGVRHADSLCDTLKRLNRNMHDDDPTWFVLPDNRELAGQLLFLYEISLPYGLDLNSEVNSDRSAFRVNVITDDLTSKQLRAFTSNATQWLRDNAPPHMVSEGMGPATMFAHHAERNIVGMIRGTTLALVLIAGVLLFAMRSIKYSLLSLATNAIPALCAFGLWGLCVGYVGFAVSTVSAMTLGIVVDDTVHFLNRYAYARRQLNQSAAEAVEFAFTSVGSALIVTSIVLGTGFLILSRSTFTINSEVGLLTAIVIACALAVDLLLLPPLLLRLDANQVAGDANAETANGD